MGGMMDILNDLLLYLDKQLGDTDPYISDEEDYEEVIKEDFPLFYIHRELVKVKKEVKKMNHEIYNLYDSME